MRKITRRGFLTASGATAGVILATGAVPQPHGKIEEKIRVGLIGTGNRAIEHLREGLWANDDLEIVAVADVYRPQRTNGMRYAWLARAQIVLETSEPNAEQKAALEQVPRPASYGDFEEMLAKERLDAVIIATPPHTHCEIALRCLNAGKHIFVETPMTTNVAEGRHLVEAAQQSNRVVQIGHQRRYHPNYNLVVKHLSEQMPLGRPVQTESYAHQNNHIRLASVPNPEKYSADRELLKGNWERHVNWRLYTEPNRGPCLDKLPAAMDTTNWFCGTPPARVYATGGIDYWRDGRTAPDTITAIFDYHVDHESERFVPLRGRDRRQDIPALNRGYAVRGTFSYGLANGEHGIHERIIGDRATAILNPKGDSRYLLETMYGSDIALRREHQSLLGDRLQKMLAAMSEEERKQFVLSHGDSYDLPGYFRGDRCNAPITAVGSEESAEVHQFRAFASDIRNGGTPRANVMAGLAAVIAGEHARRSLESGLPVDIDPELMEFDFETPSMALFDENVAPIPKSMPVLGEF